VLYRDTLRKFKDYLAGANMLQYPPDEMDKRHAVEFRNYLGKRGYAGSTINTRMEFMRTIYNIGIENNLLKDNIFSNFRRVKEIRTAQNRAFYDDEFEKIIKRLGESKNELYFYCCFIYYCFLRPNEIRYVLKKNVDLKACKVAIPAKDSKVRFFDYVDIIPAFAEELKEWTKFKKPGDYLFANDAGEPYGHNTMRQRFKKMLKGLNLNDPDICLYSFKHTGNVHAYRAGVDIKALQRQNRHTSIETTDIYLKSLMLFENTEFINKMPQKL
jgi:integrase